MRVTKTTERLTQNEVIYQNNARTITLASPPLIRIEISRPFIVASENLNRNYRIK